MATNDPQGSPLTNPARRRWTAAMGLLPLAAMAEQQDGTDSPTPQVMRRAIPSSGESLPVIGLGTYQALDVGTSASEQGPLLDVVRALTNHGGTLIDSSPMYGRAESVTGDLVSALSARPRVFLATKVWTSGRESGIRQLEESFRRMRTDRMDLMQVHNLQDWRTHAGTLDQWKADGRIRHIGITHYHEGAYGDLEKVLRARRWDFIQLNYSLAETAAEDRMLPLAADLGVAVIANRPFAQGALFSRVKGKALPGWAADIDCASWAQVFLKWIVSHPAVNCAIPASSKATHTVQNMLAGTGRMPDAEMRARIAKAFEAL